MKKIGRNEPCPCGSGKKFKNCHMGKEDELFFDGKSEIPFETSAKITSLPTVSYGRSQEIIDKLDIKELTGSHMGIKFIDLKQYRDLDILDRQTSDSDLTGGVFVNVLKTRPSDPDNVYIAISPKVNDSTIIHELAHVLTYLDGSNVLPAIAKPLSLEAGIPVEHCEHPYEFAKWFNYLKNEFEIQPDAEDTIICFLYENGMLIKSADIIKQDLIFLRSKSEQILQFLNKNSAKIDALIRELPGYIGSRVNKEDA